jgi:GrpB-like predicted nucleotidyltransferase (UPF0157 family)/GNAT superfamily N-acetyltransferase
MAQCLTMRHAIERTWGWDEGWQRADFERRFNASAVTILEVDGTDAGCLWLESRPGSVYVSDIQILPPLQRKGIATSVLRDLQSRADARGLAVALAVLQVNDGARRLYERLGFRVTAAARSPFTDMQYGIARRETSEERLRRVVREDVVIEPYDARWPELFEREQAHLRNALPEPLVRRIEHFGSTAVPGLAAKPVIDMLVEVADLELTRQQVVPILEAKATTTSGGRRRATMDRRSTRGSSGAIRPMAAARTTSTWWRLTSNSGRGCCFETTSVLMRLPPVTTRR